MDIIFNKFKDGETIKYDSNVPNKKCILVHDIIYQTVDKFPKEIVGLIISYYKRQKIVFRRIDIDIVRNYIFRRIDRDIVRNYIFSGNYVTMFLGAYDSEDEEVYCNININEDIGIKYGYYTWNVDTVGNMNMYWYGHFSGNGRTKIMNTGEYNNDRERNIKKFLDEIKIFCMKLHNENNYYKTRLGNGCEIGKYIKKCSKIKCELDNYYFVSQYYEGEYIIELTKFEYECIVRELGELRDIINRLQI